MDVCEGTCVNGGEEARRKRGVLLLEGNVPVLVVCQFMYLSLNGPSADKVAPMKNKESAEWAFFLALKIPGRRGCERGRRLCCPTCAVVAENRGP